MPFYKLMIRNQTNGNEYCHGYYQNKENADEVMRGMVAADLIAEETEWHYWIAEVSFSD